MFDLNLEELVEDGEFVVDEKTLNVTNYTKGHLDLFPTTLPTFDPFSSFQDASLDQQLNKNNALQLRQAISAYMKQCLASPIDQSKMFEDGNLVPFQIYEVYQNEEDKTEMEALISHSQLLTANSRKQLISKFQGLKGLFHEVSKLVGKQVTEEIIFIISALVDQKMDGLQQMMNRRSQDFIPKMDRFWGDDGRENILPGGWQVYEDMSYDEVKALAGRNVEQFSSQLYFSKQLKLLNFNGVCQEIKPNVNVMDKFTSLLVFIYNNVFLSMCGMSQLEQDLQEFYQELKLINDERGEAIKDSLCKRVKVE